MKKLEINWISETTFEDGSYWLSYSVYTENGRDCGYFGYERIFNVDDEEYAKDCFKTVLDSNSEISKLMIEKLSNKQYVDDVCSIELSRIIRECHGSDNEMYFVEYDDMDEETVLKIMDEVEKLGANIKEHFSFGDNDCWITVYGGVITDFLF